MLNRKTLTPILCIAALMCAVQVFNTVSGYALTAFGVLPRSVSGLPGIVLSPFVHGSWPHLLGNLLPFVLLSLMVASEGLRRYLTASVLIIVIGGALVWLFGRGSYHVGASGWVFGLWVYILARAWLRHSWSNLATALAALVFYSGMVYGFLPRYGVSFEAHIAGAVAGFVTARMLLSAPRRASLEKEFR